MPHLVIETDKTDDTGKLTTEVGTPGDEPHSATVTIGNEGSVVPVVLFVAIAVGYCVKLYFAHRARQATQETVRMALERGQPLSPELLDRLGQSPPAKRNDLRRGVVGICLGIGLAAFGLVVGQEDAVRPMLAVGLVPMLLGVAYLILWRLGGNKA